MYIGLLTLRKHRALFLRTLRLPFASFYSLLSVSVAEKVEWLSLTRRSTVIAFTWGPTAQEFSSTVFNQIPWKSMSH